MAKAQAKEKAEALKKATKAAAEKGIMPPVRKRPVVKFVQNPTSDPVDENEGSDLDVQASNDVTEGVDTDPSGVIQSGFSAFNQILPKEQAMTEDTKPAPPPMTPEERAAFKERLAAEKAAKIEAKQKAIALRAENKAKADAEKAERKAAREAQAVENKAKRDAEVAAAQDRGLNYTGTMLALRNAKDTYVRATSGRLRSSDEVAVAFDEVEPPGVIAVCLKVLSLDENPYTKLNVGQQSMNLRNRLRAAIRGNKVTIDTVITTIAEMGVATAGAAQAAKRAAREEREKAQAAKRAEADALKQARAAKAASAEVPAQATA